MRVARNRTGQLFRGIGYSVDTCRSNITKTDLWRVEIKNVSTNRQWPNPEAFNALPLSTRTKLYCDYGDEGKMIWKAHADPPRVRCMLQSKHITFNRMFHIKQTVLADLKHKTSVSSRQTGLQSLQQ